MDLQEQNLSHIKIKQSDEMFYFEHNVYNEKYLGEYISKERLDYIFTECEKIVCMCHIKKSQYEKQARHSKICLYFIINISFFFYYLFYNTLLFSKNKKKEERFIYLKFTLVSLDI